MPLIESDPKGKKVSLTLELDKRTSAMLKKYTRFSGADSEKIVAGALRRLFDQDEEFGPWLKEQDKSAKTPASPEAARDTE